MLCEQTLSSYRRRLASLLCSMTEIYLTDCCEEPEAEARCESFLTEAISLDPENSETLQTLASVRLSQSRPAEAETLVRQSLSLWTPLEPGSRHWPSFGHRMSLARLLIELSLFDEALTVLQINQTEDDEDPQVWYLFGWTYYLVAEAQTAAEDEGPLPAPREIQELQTDAVECLETVLALEKKDPGSVPEPLLVHARELLENLRIGD